jgi:hypothetical protein
MHLFVVTDRSDLIADHNTGFARGLWQMEDPNRR